MAQRLTWWDVEAAAYFGTPVRFELWPAGQYLVVRAGAGTTKAVFLIVYSGAENVITPETFGANEMFKEGWQIYVP